jgi:hypothetical protein
MLVGQIPPKTSEYSMWRCSRKTAGTVAVPQVQIDSVAVWI